MEKDDHIDGTRVNLFPRSLSSGKEERGDQGRQRDSEGRCLPKCGASPQHDRFLGGEGSWSGVSGSRSREKRDGEGEGFPSFSLSWR